MKILISVLLALSALTLNGIPVESKDHNENVNCSPEELAALKEFRELVGPLPQPYMNTDGFLINWIRGSDSGGNYKTFLNSTYYKYTFAPGFDLNKAAENLEKTLTWRYANKIDGILSEDFSDLKKQYPFDISRKDHNGRPVFLLEYANWDLSKATGGSPAEIIRFFRYIDYLLESLAAKARQSRTTDYTYLVDVSGFKMDTHACPKCLAVYSYYPTHFETHYPQMTRHIFHVNAPKEFITFGKIFDSNLSPLAQKGHKIYDNNTEVWLKEVMKIIPVDQVPQHYIEGTTAVTKKKSSPVVYPWHQACGGCKVSN